ncbi:MAG: hypothetical protein ABIB47_06490 [Candidatus Woesearchaeota archaeon]
MSIGILKEKGPVHRILGKVEIKTIIKRIEGKRLTQIERNYLSRSIRPKLIGAAILSQENILEKIGRPKAKITKSQILYNLTFYGYDLITAYKIPKQKILEIEELIAKILINLPEARLIEGIPILIIKNKIDTFELLETAIKYDLKNQIGYLLQIAFIIGKQLGMLNKINYLKRLLNYFKEERDEEISILGQDVKDDVYMEFLKKTSPRLIKEWNLLGRFYEKDFIKNAELYLS